MLPLTTLALRLLGFRRTQSALACLAPMDNGPGRNQAQTFVDRVHLIAKMLKVAAQRSPFCTNCLSQSLVLWWLLRRQRIKSDLRIGVRKGGNRFEAHAWVEVPGTVLNDRSDVRRRFVSFERAVVPVEEASK